MDMSTLLWDETSRDMESERLELARTAAMNDAQQLVGPLVFQASTEADLGHRLALAEPHLHAIAQKRGYPASDLEADLRRQWGLLAHARTVTAGQEAERRTVTAAAEQRMDQAVARLAARAAKENPAVPMAECLRMATEAVAKHADAYPLAYESWGGTADGPITDRAKHWKPPGMKTPGAPASPAAAAAPTGGAADDVAKLDADLGAARDDMAPRWDAVTASWDWSKPFRNAGDALRDRWNRTTGDPDLHQSESDWTDDHKAWNENLDHAQDEMSAKWDANAAAPGASHHHQPSQSSDLLSGFDQARTEMNQKWDANAAAPGASEGYTPARPEVPGGFSDADSASHHPHQDSLPTDPYPTFTHQHGSDAPLPRASGPAPGGFRS